MCYYGSWPSVGGMEGIHYLDDFLFAGEQGSPTCGQALDTCQILRLPVVPEKVEGSSPCSGRVYMYLGILIDTIKREVRLPEDKLARLLAELAT